MALAICSYCGKEKKVRYFPNDWKVIVGKNVLLNKVACNQCLERMSENREIKTAGVIKWHSTVQNAYLKARKQKL